MTTPCKVALVTGATSQDASYLFETLLERGYSKVYGMVRRSASSNLWRIEHLKSFIELVPGDLTDQSSLEHLIQLIKPDEIYNLAAQSFVKYSFEAPVSTSDITGMGTLRLLEATRLFAPKSKFFQASSSEMYGKIQETPQNESTRFYPRSPYGTAKAFAHHTCVNYREAYSMYISCGIMFNHESPRRGLEFVSRKITDGVARVKLGLEQSIKLGNLEAKRDFGFAGDYMRAAQRILQEGEPGDYVVATGETYSIREFLEQACECAGLRASEVYEEDKRFMRPSDVDFLLGDSSRLRILTQWRPTVNFTQLVRMMYEADYERLSTLNHSNS